MSEDEQPATIEEISGKLQEIERLNVDLDKKRRRIEGELYAALRQVGVRPYEEPPPAPRATPRRRLPRWVYAALGVQTALSAGALLVAVAPELATPSLSPLAVAALIAALSVLLAAGGIVFLASLAAIGVACLGRLGQQQQTIDPSSLWFSQQREAPDLGVRAQDVPHLPDGPRTGDPEMDMRLKAIERGAWDGSDEVALGDMMDRLRNQNGRV